MPGAPATSPYSSAAGPTQALRAAAIILFINGIITIMLAVKTGGMADSASEIIASLVLGGMIWQGSEKAVRWARYGVVVGCILSTVGNLFTGNIFVFVIVAPFFLALILLLFGTPGKPRIIFSGVCAGLHFLILIIFIFMPADAPGTDESLLGSDFLDESGWEALADTRIRGTDYPYSLELPDTTNWQRMTRPQMAAEGYGGDIWLLNLIDNAQVMVMVEELGPGVDTNLNKYARQVVSIAGEDMGKDAISRKKKLRTRSGLEGRGFDLKDTSDETAIIYRYGIFVGPSNRYQVVCIGKMESFPQLSKQFSEIIRSFSTN